MPPNISTPARIFWLVGSSNDAPPLARLRFGSPLRLTTLPSAVGFPACVQVPPLHFPSRYNTPHKTSRTARALDSASLMVSRRLCSRRKLIEAAELGYHEPSRESASAFLRASLRYWI